MMQKSKYMTIAEYAKENATNNIGKILVLSEHDIDAMTKSSVFRLEGKQVWYGKDIKVFPQMPVELPGNANFIEIKAIKTNKTKQND